MLMFGGPLQAVESVGLRVSSGGTYFFAERPAGMNDAQARKAAEQRAQNSGWTVESIELFTAEGTRAIQLGLRRGPLNLGGGILVWSLQPAVWSADGQALLDVYVQQPATFTVEPEAVSAQTHPAVDQDGFTYASYRVNAPVRLVVRFPAARARILALRLAGLLLLPIVLGAGFALGMRARGRPNLMVFQKISLGLSGLLFLLYFHLSSDEEVLLWLRLYFGRLAGPGLFLLLFASFVGMKWTAVLMGTVEKEFKVTPGRFLGSILRTYSILTIPMMLYVGLALFIENDVTAVAAALVVAVGSSLVAPFLFQLLVRAKPVTDAGLLEQVREVAARARVRAPRTYVYVAGPGRGANAFVAGWIAPFRALFVNDVLLAAFTPEEFQAVVAHELGHWKRRHPLWLALFVVLAMVAGSVMWQFTPAAWRDGALIAAMIVGTVAFFHVSKKFERQADEVAFQLYGEAYVTALLKVHATAGDVPLKGLDFLQSHPSIADRIRFLTGK